jgi:hypothetical protein
MSLRKLRWTKRGDGGQDTKREVKSLAVKGTWKLQHESAPGKKYLAGTHDGVVRDRIT